MHFDKDRPVAPNAFIFYHANCADGFGARWAISFATPSDNAFPLDYDQPLPEIPDGAEVYFLDFCFKADQRNLLADLAARCSRVVVVDHHATGGWIAEYAPDGVEVVFDQSKSGAVLTWEALYGAPAPLLLQYVQDRDLWRHELPHSEAVSLAIRFTPRELVAWSILENVIRHNVLALARAGEAIMSYRDVLVKQTVASAARYELAEGWPQRFVWMICQPSLVSDACHAALTAHPDALFAVALVIERGESPDDDKWRVGLRARNGGYNVAAIAQRFGGGGHKAAAGFSFALSRNMNNLYLLLQWIAEAWQQIPREGA